MRRNKKGNRRRNPGKWAAFLMLTVLTGAYSPLSALAASPRFARTEEEWVSLEDNLIEFDELADLIHEYNATVLDNDYEYNKFREDYGDTRREVSDSYYDLAQDLYSDMSGDDDASSRMSDLSLQIQADNLMDQADDTLEDSKIYYLTYRQAEMNLVVQAQNYMISYYDALLDRQEQEAAIADAEIDYALAQVQAAAGVATQTDVLEAEETLLIAENALIQLDKDIQETKESFYVLLGYANNSEAEIGELPLLDLEVIEAMDPAADEAQALENNYTLQINERKLENAPYSQLTIENLKTTIENNKKQIRASLADAYRQVLSAKLSYEQAQTQAAVDEENTRIAASQLAAGVITQSAYEKQAHTSENSRIDEEKASLSLLTAILNYGWMVDGLASAE